MQPRAMDRFRRASAPLRAVAIAAAYIAITELAVALRPVEGFAAPIWPAAGIALAALLLYGVRYWPAVFAGSLAVAVIAKQPLLAVVCIAIANTIGPVLGAWMLRARAGFRPTLDRLRDAAAFILLAATGATAVAATLAGTTFALAHHWTIEETLRFWWVWWLSDVVGVLVVAPVVLIWASRPARLTARRRVEFAFVCLLLALVAAAIFGPHFSDEARGYPIGYLVFPVLAWGAVRFGQRGAATLIAFLALIAALETSFAGGPFAGGDPEHSLLLLQAYFGVLAASTLLLASVIDERARVEEEMRVQQERLRLAVEGTEQGMSDYDVVTGAVIRTPHLARLLGYEPDALAPTVDAWTALVHPDDQTMARQAMADHFEGRTPLYESEHRVRTRGGDWVWIADRGKVVERDAAGRPLRMIGMFSDITARRRMEAERRRLEVQLQQAQKFESLGVLAGGVAHDFNNLLVGILGNASLARSEVPADHPAVESLEQIEASAVRAAELTRQMLAVSGRGQFVVEPIDLSRAIADIGQLLDALVPSTVTLTLDLAARLPLIDADASQIRQLVMNLVSNAGDALGDEARGGTITLRTGQLLADRATLAATVLDDALPEGAYVYVEVTDNGAGMDAETLARIFDPFYSTKFIGRGLGLPAVLGIARGHHGAVAVDSAPGRGTTVRVLFPIVAEAGPLTEAAAMTDGDSSGSLHATILIADDEAAVRAVARRTLERAGCRVILAEDGVEALRMLREGAVRIDAVLLDATMPRLSGDEVLREIRETHPDLPVILTSGYAEPDATRHFAGLGLSGFLQKPFRPGDLVERFREVLAQRRP